jgi:hypothetical protein
MVWATYKSPRDQSVRQLLLALMWTAGIALSLRGGAGVAQALYRIATGTPVTPASLLWEAWFICGGGLFCLSAHFESRGGCPT